MSIKLQLDRSINQFELLKHPFYQAWSDGTLPVSALKSYAKEYGAFIAELPAAWDTLQDFQTSEEEIEHAKLWNDFASTLNTRIDEPDVDEVKALVITAKSLFSSRETALGALYAFEAQQIHTSVSKLNGLKKYYDFPKKAERYFELHTNTTHEVDKIIQDLEMLSSTQKESAREACAVMAKSLWDALTGIYSQ